MCLNCCNDSCSGCKENPSIPNVTSALKFDGEKFVCTGEFTVRSGDSLNDLLNTLMNQICSNSSGIGGSGSFNLTTPVPTDGVTTLGNYALNGNAAGGSSNDFPIVIDRNNCHEDIVISLANLPDPSMTISTLSSITFTPEWSTPPLPLINGQVNLQWTPGVLGVGNHTVDLVLTSATCGTRTQVIELKLT